MSEGNGGLVPVRIRDCQCPDTPHAEEGDVVYLPPRISTPAALECQRHYAASMRDAIREVLGDKPVTDEMVDVFKDQLGQVSIELMTLRWTPIFLRLAKGWNVVDEVGLPVPFDPQILIDDFSIGSPVADKANDLYFDVVFSPLVLRLQALSQTGPTKPPTSRRRSSTRTRRGRSSRATTGAMTQ
jgi:hypothetical protein